MKVNIHVARSVDVPTPVERARVLLDDYESAIRRFPKLRRLTALKPDAYLWEMAPIGSRTAGIVHEVSYAARYQVDAAAGLLEWQPLPGHGNATVEGRMRLEPRGKATRLSFDVRGELRDVPVPLMYRLVAPPFIQGTFTRLVDVFLEQTRDALS
jgi:carbon monoxide dehydrogenase subunit G